jgi:hypothetical protein
MSDHDRDDQEDEESEVEINLGGSDWQDGSDMGENDSDTRLPSMPWRATMTMSLNTVDSRTTCHKKYELVNGSDPALRSLRDGTNHVISIHHNIWLISFNQPKICKYRWLRHLRHLRTST